MAKMSIDTICIKIEEKQGDMGIRATAQEIGISAATLSRVKRGKLPDLETFGKICRWLDLNPSAALGVKIQSDNTERTRCAVHFKKEDAVKPETAQALARLILTAQKAMSLQNAER